MAYKPVDKEMFSMIADAPIPFYVNGLSGSIIFQTDGNVISILMTHPVPGRNPAPIAHIPFAPVVHQPASATRKEFTSKILREPPPPQQPKHSDATPSTEVPKSVRFALAPQAEPQRTQQEQRQVPSQVHQQAHRQDARAPLPESSASSASSGSSASSSFSKKPGSVEERSSQRIRFDIRKSGENSWDVFNGDVMIEESQFKKLNQHPDEHNLRFICGKKEAQMAIYVNPAGEYFLKHGDKKNADWYKYKNN